MSRRHELSMESYDRLFPSQDTMPRGGFGNLIALPLQHEPRALGNSIFLDYQLRPYPDDQQWSYLASLSRIDVAAVDQIARDATDRGSVVGVQIASTEEEDATPWAPVYCLHREDLNRSAWLCHNLYYAKFEMGGIAL